MLDLLDQVPGPLQLLRGLQEAKRQPAHPDRRGDAVHGQPGLLARHGQADLLVKAGSPVTLEVRNDGSKNHNLTIGSLHVSTGSMRGGDVTTVRFTAPGGTTEFRCTWHPGMTGQIVGT